MKQIYLNEYNLSMGNTVYLPLATGMLRSYAETFPYILDQYEFAPFIYRIDTPENILKQYDNPSVAAFSVSMWNYNLSLEVAKRIKKKWPLCLIVFGGPSVPDKATYPIDKIIKGEGESQFVGLLLGQNTPKQALLDVYPSPYTAGLFDGLINETTQFQAIVETNRGCGNLCSYCYWGHGGLDKKYRFFTLDYIRDVARWIGRNKIKYVFCADSNFGIFPRDVEIAKIFAETKAHYGYPEKFRVCYGKTESDSIFQAAQVLHNADLAKAVTLSRQSTNPVVLSNINRTNIKNSTFEALQHKYTSFGIPTYSELILGLPGETFESFKEGVLSSLKHSQNNNLFIYHCSVLPNTQLADKEYQKKFGIKTVRLPMAETHCEVRPDNYVKEYEEIIIETNTMSREEWVLLTAWSWEIQLKYSLGYNERIGTPISNLFLDIANDILRGIPRSRVIPEAGNIYWEPEEYAFLLLHKKNIPDLKQFAKENILYGRKSVKKTPEKRNVHCLHSP